MTSFVKKGWAHMYSAPLLALYLVCLGSLIHVFTDVYYYCWGGGLISAFFLWYQAFPHCIDDAIDGLYCCYDSMMKPIFDLFHCMRFYLLVGIPSEIGDYSIICLETDRSYASSVSVFEP